MSWKSICGYLRACTTTCSSVDIHTDLQDCSCHNGKVRMQRLTAPGTCCQTMPALPSSATSCRPAVGTPASTPAQGHAAWLVMTRRGMTLGIAAMGGQQGHALFCTALTGSRFLAEMARTTVSSRPFANVSDSIRVVNPGLYSLQGQQHCARRSALSHGSSAWTLPCPDAKLYALMSAEAHVESAALLTC